MSLSAGLGIFDPNDCKGISFPLLLVQAHFSVSPRSVGQRKVTHSGLLRTSQVEQTDEAGLHNLAKSPNLSGFCRAIGAFFLLSFMPCAHAASCDVAATEGLRTGDLQKDTSIFDRHCA
jgi:hypothetical protein